MSQTLPLSPYAHGVAPAAPPRAPVSPFREVIERNEETWRELVERLCPSGQDEDLVRGEREPT